MAQKSLSVLHRIDSSMIWKSSIYNKNYKWLSYNLWFAYIQFYKVIFFFDYFFIIKTNLTRSSNFYIYNYKYDYTQINKHFVRFSYYIDLYCVEFSNFLLLLNIYFKTDLLFYKDKKKKKFYLKKKKKDFLD